MAVDTSMRLSLAYYHIAYFKLDLAMLKLPKPCLFTQMKSIVVTLAVATLNKNAVSSHSRYAIYDSCHSIDFGYVKPSSATAVGNHSEGPPKNDIGFVG